MFYDVKVQSNEQQNRLQIYETIVEIMEPHVNKLKQFMFFQVSLYQCGDPKPKQFMFFQVHLYQWGDPKLKQFMFFQILKS